MEGWEGWGTAGGTKLSLETPQSLQLQILCLDLDSDLQLVLGQRAGSKPGIWTLWRDSRSGVQSVVGVTELSESTKGSHPST